MNTQTSCLSTTETQRGTTHKQVEVSEGAFKSEHIAASKVKCYVKVLSAATPSKTMIEGCETLNPDTSSLDITYHEVPSVAECDRSTVAVYPGSSDWDSTHYEEESWYDLAPTQAVTACTSR